MLRQLPDGEWTVEEEKLVAAVIVEPVIPQPIIAKPVEDIIRIIRILEYVGPRSKVEQNISHSIQGTIDNGNGVKITAVTLGQFGEIMAKASSSQ